MPPREIEVKDLVRFVGRYFIHVTRQRVGRKRIPTSPANPFYGYSAEVISEVCGISVGSAEHFKAGRRTPPKSVLRLFRLYRDGKILGPEWTGYRVIRERMFGPNGKAITPVDIAHWSLVWQILAEKDNAAYHKLLEEFSKQA